jgi:Cof subfamily protein (haloacid dehalogenase superfamily)
MHHRLKDIKLIVIDIDGTLVDAHGRIGDKTKKLARELKNHQIYCTLSSARSYFYSHQIADELGVELPIITLDGALIKSKDTDVYKAVMSSRIIRRAAEAAEKNYGKISVCTEDYLYISPKNSVIREYTRLNAQIREITEYDKIDGVLEILIYCEDKGTLRAIKNNFRFPFNTSVSISITKSPNNDYYLLTIKKKGSDKLRSVKRLVKYLKLHRKNVAVIGDWHNDMPLFDYGAFNFAVQNAIPELKRKADYITNCTNNEDAVSEVLDIVYKNNVEMGEVI